MSSVANPPPSTRRRRLRAVFAADVADFGGYVSANETRALQDLWRTRKIAGEALDAFGGWLFGMPGDGIFALFESAVDAVQCALVTQSRLLATGPFNTFRMRIGIHLGEVVFQDDQPFGEALVIAARLESLAEPGGILISAAVMDAVAPRIAATFETCGFQSLKHIPRRIATFKVTATPGLVDQTVTVISMPPQIAPPEPMNETSRGRASRRASKREPLDATVDSVTRATGDALDKTTRPRSKSKLSATVVAQQGDPVPVLPTGKPAFTPASSTTRIGTAEPSKTAGDGAVPPAVEACLSDLTLALTKHLGPLAKLIASRQVASSKTADDFIAKLAAEIPAARDRDKFLAEARIIVARKR